MHTRVALFLMLFLVSVSFVERAHAVIYEFTALSGEVLGTMEFAEPPSSQSTGWSSNNSADLSSLFLDDTTFGMGSGNVLDLFTSFLTYDVASLDGSELDFSLGIQDDTPGGAAGGISDFIQLSFGTSPNFDIVESFANAAFVAGDWTARTTTSVLEPGTLGLLGAGLLGFAIKRRKKAA